MNNYNRIIMICLFILPVKALFSQTAMEQAKKDFTELSESYKSSKHKFSSTYKLYADSLPDVAVSEVSGITIVNGASQYQKLGEIESYHTPAYSLIVNHTEKTIYVLPAEKKHGPQVAGLVFNDPQGFISTCDSVTYTDHQQDRQYVFFTRREMYNEITVTYNRKKKQVQSISLRSDAQQSVLRIVYSDFSSKDIPGQDWFSYTKFLETDNNRLKCRQAYESYQLFNKVNNPDNIK